MEFKRYRLGELGEVCMCKRIMKTETSEKGDIPFYKIGTFGDTPDVFIDRSLYEEYKNKYSFPKKGDVLISAAGTIGRSVIYNGEDAYYQDSNIVWIDNDESKVLNSYLFYIYKEIKWKISTGSTILRLYNENIRETEIIVPNLDVQKKISDFLSLIDKKIALNTRMNAELESMAKQLYDYWFVQFDFPDENGKPYKSSGGKMVYNPTLKREIPAGWEVKGLGDVLTFSNGINYEKGIEGDKEYKIINVRNITSSSVYINKSELDTISLPSKQAGNYLIEENDIIIARSGTPGSTRLIDNPIDVIYCGFIIKGSPIDSAYKYYVTFFLKQLEGTQATKTGGSILQNVSQETLKSLNLVLPGKHLFTTFNEKIKALFTLLNKKQDENNELTHLRDSLLPMLMNGQVTVE